MHPQQPDSRLIHYRVTLGHARVTVAGRNPAEALCEARRRLATELPRMWDVVHAAADERFELEPAPPPRDAPSEPAPS